MLPPHCVAYSCRLLATTAVRLTAPNSTPMITLPTTIFCDKNYFWPRNMFWKYRQRILCGATNICLEWGGGSNKKVLYNLYATFYEKSINKENILPHRAKYFLSIQTFINYSKSFELPSKNCLRCILPVLTMGENFKF